MGALAKALRKDQTVTVAGVDVSVSMLSITELYECVVEASKGMTLGKKSPQDHAQEAIETGRLPFASFDIILAKACKDLDREDRDTLLAQKDCTEALKVIAVAMGNETGSMKIVKQKAISTKKKPRRKSNGKR